MSEQAPNVEDGWVRIPCDICGGFPVIDRPVDRHWRYGSYYCQACHDRQILHARRMEEADRQRKLYGWVDGPDQGKMWVLSVFYSGELDSLAPEAIRAKGKDWWAAVDGIGKVTLGRIEKLAGGWE